MSTEIEKYKDHLVVDENHHRAVKTIAAERKIEMIEYVHQILDERPEIKSALRRIKGH